MPTYKKPLAFFAKGNENADWRRGGDSYPGFAGVGFQPP